MHVCVKNMYMSVITVIQVHNYNYFYDYNYNYTITVIKLCTIDKLHTILSRICLSVCLHHPCQTAEVLSYVLPFVCLLYLCCGIILSNMPCMYVCSVAIVTVQVLYMAQSILAVQ